MTNKPILFKESILDVNGEKMTMMYFYRDFFFLETENQEQISLVNKDNFPDELLEDILSKKENQQEISDDEKLTKMLDDIILKIETQEGEEDDGE